MTLKAIELDVTAVVRFKDITWTMIKEEARPLLDGDEIAGLTEGIHEAIADSLDWLNEMEDLGGFTLEVYIGGFKDVTAQLEDQIKATD